MKLQIFQQEETSQLLPRLQNANFECTRREDGNWNVHFWADYAPTIDRVISDADLWTEIDVMRNIWRDNIRLIK